MLWACGHAYHVHTKHFFFSTDLFANGCRGPSADSSRATRRRPKFSPQIHRQGPTGHAAGETRDFRGVRSRLQHALRTSQAPTSLIFLYELTNSKPHSCCHVIGVILQKSSCPGNPARVISFHSKILIRGGLFCGAISNVRSDTGCQALRARLARGQAAGLP